MVVGMVLEFDSPHTLAFGQLHSLMVLKRQKLECTTTPLLVPLMPLLAENRLSIEDLMLQLPDLLCTASTPETKMTIY
uniref:Kinase n=1 Tax=Solanum tuberosum TaxID=4113 RepID=M0ZID1_SOLTU